MAKELRRIEIGFDGGQVIALRIEQKELDGLRKSLGGGGFKRVVTDDAELDVDLGKVAFLRAADDEHSVGFGAA